MAIILVLAGCFLHYSNSKYFPKHFSFVEKRIEDYPNLTRLAAHGLFALSLLLFVQKHGFFTGMAVFLMVLMLGLCLLIMFLPLNKKYAYVLAGLSVFFIVLENLL